MKKKYLLLTCVITLSSGFVYSQCKSSIHLPFSGNAQDISGNAKHGTVTGATLTTDRNGNPNSAYMFDGVDDHISVADDTANDLDKAWTIMAWIKPDSGYGKFKDNHVSIVEKWGNAGSSLAAYGMGIHDNGALEGFTHTGSAGTYQWSTATIQTNTWTHVAVTRGNDDSIRLYLNGTLNKTYISVQPQNSGFDLHIGMASDPSIKAAYPTSYRFKGVIDDVRLYKCQLLPSQFTEINPPVNITDMIRIFPNPTNGNFHISQNVSENYEVRIFDANGKLIQSGSNRDNFDLSSGNGIYMVQFHDLNSGLVINRKIALMQ